MLLNEFLKEHRTVDALKAQITALTARLKEQEVSIHNMSNRLELSNPATKVVLKTP